LISEQALSEGFMRITLHSLAIAINWLIPKQMEQQMEKRNNLASSAVLSLHSALDELNLAYDCVTIEESRAFVDNARKHLRVLLQEANAAAVELSTVY
jgi:hypothetical protein